MSLSRNWFESAAIENWSQAVMEASRRLSEVRDQVVLALESTIPDVRSAAIAAFNEANDESAHELIVRLANDPDAHVRGEVLEYIEEFPQESDAALLLSSLKAGENLYLASSGLRKLFGGGGPLVDEDDVNTLSAAIAVWEEVIRVCHRDA